MTKNRITANLPSRDFRATEYFYARLGFTTQYRGDSWLILDRAGMQIEFFSYPELNPNESWFSACMRLEEIDGLHAEWAALEIFGKDSDLPRLSAPFILDGAPRMFTLHDPDGSLWRVMETKEAA